MLQSNEGWLLRSNLIPVDPVFWALEIHIRESTVFFFTPFASADTKTMRMKQIRSPSVATHRERWNPNGQLKKSSRFQHCGLVLT